ncbi:hypothetical protein [Senegalimassilia anaerobia]|uniref:hypothetical protein n=1 Tax=Senegalimassilia anaerobia TaxID=1473216 RepID=UPI0026EC246C|nr:hypothetical protein [Senegalimassilia anaerobia]
MTTTDSIANSEIAAIEQLAQKQIVEDLISKKKKSSNKQEMAEFTKEWSKLARKEGASNDIIGLLIDGFSIAGANPLFELMDTDESCLEILRIMKKLPKIEENQLGASLRVYLHLFALSVNNGRSWDCINSIISAIPRYAFNKEGKVSGTNAAAVSKYLLRELNVSKASKVLLGTNLQESTANKLATIFFPAFEEALSKKKPVKTEVDSVRVLKQWLESKTTKIDATTANCKPATSTLQPKGTASSAKTGSGEIDGKPIARAIGPNITVTDAKVEQDEFPTYDSVVTAVRKLEHNYAATRSKLSSVEDKLRAKEESIKKLKMMLDEANSLITSLKEANNEKQQQINSASRLIEKLQHETEEVKSTAEARAKMITMLDKSRDQKGNEALAKIASKLKADYGDFKEYEEETMTVELGEIVKLQLGQVFETLKSVGVKL